MIQRKPPAKRLFPGGVGGVFNAPVDAPPIPSVSTSVPSTDALQPETVQTMTAHEMLVAINHPKAVAAETKEQRYKRKKREQDAFRKKQLAIPWHERDLIAKEQAKEAKTNRIFNSNDSDAANHILIHDAPQGKGEVITGGHGSEKLDLITGHQERTVLLGGHNEDDEGRSVHVDKDRGNIKPEGSGRRAGERDDNEHEAAEFEVKLSGPKSVERREQYNADLRSLFYIYMRSESDPGCDLDGDRPVTSDGYKCMLCGTCLDWESEAIRHIEMVHTDPAFETHDDRAGDVLRAYIHRGRRDPRPKTVTA